VFAFVVLGLVFSILSQEIGWEERLRNGLFCVELDVKLNERLGENAWLTPVPVCYRNKSTILVMHTIFLQYLLAVSTAQACDDC